MLLYLLLLRAQSNECQKCSLYLSCVNTEIHRLTVEFVDLRQVGEDAGQLIRVQHRPHLLEKDLVQDLQSAQVRHLGGKQL